MALSSCVCVYVLILIHFFKIIYSILKKFKCSIIYHNIENKILLQKLAFFFNQFIITFVKCEKWVRSELGTGFLLLGEGMEWTSLISPMVEYKRVLYMPHGRLGRDK